ncbi:MAG: formylglycine-generating enzyme family protein [Deltaproteobacteria bacterium]|nr:formylglycine-generating enzyme family protein [Deltaproteobacteria bacterium]
MEKHPVTQIGFEEAQAYARWAGKRLPTELEWERLARGASWRSFPWGDGFNPSLVHGDAARGCLMPVDAHPDGASEEGVQDLIGNASEWTVDADPGTPVLRGGCYLDPPELLKPGTRVVPANGDPSPFVGFRCVQDA